MTSEKTRRNFLGIPVHGDITEADRRAPQRPLSDLEPLIRAVIDDPYVHSFGWAQYTPYFNDGEPCVFSVGTPWFRTIDDLEEWHSAKHRADEGDEDDDEYDEDNEANYKITSDRLEVRDYGDGHPSLGKREYEWVGDYPNRVKKYGLYEGEHEASYLACAALEEAFHSGAFEDVLLEAFGDHCQVTVKATGITVDEYTHD